MNTNIYKKVNKAYKFIFTAVVLLCMVAKINAQPKLDWVSRFNGYNGDDVAKAMTIDKDGFVYVTGNTENKEGGQDIMTIKYSPAGKEIWSAVFSENDNGYMSESNSNAIAADEFGNAYVTGSVRGYPRGSELVLIKYNAKGNQEFVKYYAGAGHIEDSNEEGTAVTVDNKGSVIVTGFSDGRITGFDFCTIKYSPDGDMEWLESFDRMTGQDDKPVKVKTDKENNVIVSGYSEGMNSSKDYVTIKYNSSGKEQWKAFYNGIGGNIAINDDEVKDLAVDEYGNTFVTGYSYGVGTGKDILTVMYDNNGSEMWVSRLDNFHLKKGLAIDDEANALVLDNSGNVYVTGRTVSSEGDRDFITAKINSKGKTAWTKNYSEESSDGFGDDEANALSVDTKGNVFVAGYKSGMSFGQNKSCGYSKEFVTIKYSSNGKLLWEKTYNGTGRFENSDDIAKGIALDGKGGIFVMGESMGESTEKDFCLIRYDEGNTKKYADEVQDKAVLRDNYPNPFNPVTKISFDIPLSSNVKLTIYDISGREIALLENKTLKAGSYSYDWDASNVSSGTYFYRIQADGFVKTKKMQLIK